MKEYDPSKALESVLQLIERQMDKLDIFRTSGNHLGVQLCQQNLNQLISEANVYNKDLMKSWILDEQTQ